MELSYQAIGRRIKKIRDARGMTQDDLAFRCGLSTQHISNIERAHTKLSLPALVKISNVLEVTVDELLCDSMYKAKHILRDDFSRLLEDSTEQEAKAMLETLVALKAALRRTFSEHTAD